jgi:antirestriction protein ArdC
MKREEVKELVERGVRELNEALAAGKSDRLQQYLNVMARFPRYSFNNCMLIALQFPEAQLIQGFHAWRKLGRTVKKGEKGIGIIAPMVGKKKDEDAKANEDGEKSIFGFKVVHVFDVSQTEGDDLPEFAEVSGDPGENIPAVESLIREWGIELVYEEIPCGADGLSKKGTIVIDPDLEPAKRLLTLVHEASHERLHADAHRRKETTKTIRETEAEAVAHVVCQALGLNTLEHCADYIQLYNGDAEVFAKSMEYIQKTAAEILAGIKSHVASLDSEAEELAA